MYAEKEKIWPAYVSKHNSNHEKQVILLMISNREKGCIRSETLATWAKSEGGQWHYLAVKKLSALLRGITSKHHGVIYCLNYLNSVATEKKLESHEKVCENKDFCNVIMHSEDTKILEFN